MASIAITHAEVLEALRAAVQQTPDDPPGAMTSTELAHALDLPKGTVVMLLRGLITEGVIECVRVRRSTIDGRAARVPAYRSIVRVQRRRGR